MLMPQRVLILSSSCVETLIRHNIMQLPSSIREVELATLALTFMSKGTLQGQGVQMPAGCSLLKVKGQAFPSYRFWCCSYSSAGPTVSPVHQHGSPAAACASPTVAHQCITDQALRRACAPTADLHRADRLLAAASHLPGPPRLPGHLQRCQHERVVALQGAGAVATGAEGAAAAA